MGIDQSIFWQAVEDEFGIVLPHDGDFSRHYQKSASANRGDVQVGQIVDWLIEAIEQQNPSQNVLVFERLKGIFARCFHIDESEITLDMWMIKDLRLD